MRTAQLDKPVSVKDRPADPIIHVFYVAPGRLHLLPGDKALCGYVKKNDHPGWDPKEGRANCVVCCSLDGRP